jgi:hypothetical protein
VSGGVLSDWAIVRGRCEWGSSSDWVIVRGRCEWGSSSDWVILIKYDLFCLTGYSKLFISRIKLVNEVSKKEILKLNVIR